MRFIKLFLVSGTLIFSVAFILCVLFAILVCQIFPPVSNAYILRFAIYCGIIACVPNGLLIAFALHKQCK